MSKQKTLHRHLHPIHWHVSMFVAIAALLITSFKCSEEMLRALRTAPVSHAAVIESVVMRDVETGHSPIILNIGTRQVSVTGS